MNAMILRGRTVPMSGYELVRATVKSDGTFALENLQGRPAVWLLVLPRARGADRTLPDDRRPGHDHEQGPHHGGRYRRCRWRARSRVAWRMCRRPWRARSGSIAFDATIPCARGTRRPPTGRSEPEDLPPGRYGLKAGHDAYSDPHVPRCEKAGEKHVARDFWSSRPEPWQGAVVVTVEPGKTARGVVVDFRPPGPLVEPPKEAAKIPPKQLDRDAAQARLEAGRPTS